MGAGGWPNTEVLAAFIAEGTQLAALEGGIVRGATGHGRQQHISVYAEAGTTAKIGDRVEHDDMVVPRKEQRKHLDREATQPRLARAASAAVAGPGRVARV